MKHLTLFLIVLSGTVYSQKLKDRIQGDWVCVGIGDSKGQPTKGKFGSANKYLKFSFKKNKLFFSEAPFDKGGAMDVTFKDDRTIDLLPTAVYELPEQIYEVINLNSDQLTLTTKGQTGEPITYKFLNQKNFTKDMENKVVDHGILIVQHLRLSKTDAKNINRAFEYRVSNDTVFLGPSPTFGYPQGGSFGQIFSFNIKLPKTFKLDEPTNEMIVDFDVSTDGVSNIKIVSGLNAELDTEVVRVMEKLRKSWKPVVIDGKEIKTTSRFHLYFYMTISELQLPWK